MISDEGTLPTIFAKKLGESCDLYSEVHQGVDFVKQRDMQTRLIAFQQMSISCKFDEALIAYHGFALSDEQVAALQIVYKSTKPWMLGHVVGVLLRKLDDPKITNRDFAESVRTIVEQINEKDVGADNLTKNGKVKGLLVKLSKTDEEKK